MSKSARHGAFGSALEIWSAQQCREADAHTASAFFVASELLVERASLAVTRVVVELSPARVHLLVGKGMDGADALVCARQLAQIGVPVTLELLDGAATLSTHVARLASALAYGARVDQCDLAAAGLSVIVDGVIGVGGRGPLRQEAAQLLRRYRDVNARIVAIDIPSGLDADTGLGDPDGLHADVTVTFDALKPGMVFGPDSRRAGRIKVAQIGLRRPGPAGAFARVLDWRDVRSMLSSLVNARHKGERGHLGVVGGSAFLPGAPLLACRAAMAIGTGLVTLAVRGDAAPADGGGFPELMYAPLTEKNLLARCDALVIGPGIIAPSHAHEQLVAQLRADPRPACWDAGALTWFDPMVSSQSERVLTPHPGEGARLLARLHGERDAWTLARVLRDPFMAHRALVECTGAVIVLKGERTIIGDANSTEVVIGDAPALAVGGSGDVLAGLIGGLLARGLAGLDAARVACVLHAAVGQQATRGALSGKTATDFVSEVPVIVSKILEGSLATGMIEVLHC